jgi:ATP-dependent helicase HrpB
MPIPLPIDSHIDAIVALVRARRAVVVTAAPGAGKTTRVPPALCVDGPTLLLQPRRVAARAIARRISEERGWTIGREVGWHVRFDRRFGSETRLLVATEGILTARLQEDPLLAGLTTVIIDEFHERSIHADLGLALARRAWIARDDLRLVVMSATLDAHRVSDYLGGCPVVEVPGRVHAIDVSYRPDMTPEQAIVDAVPRTQGALLCFLAGAPEIRRTAERVIPALASANVPVAMLHGGLDADEQDAALRPSPGRRVILATNLAETTLTVPDVTTVVDTGWHKVARFDPARAIDSLERERISQDSADQRAGRAGRTQAGIVIRLWDARDRLRPHREPEIARVDLAATVLAVLAWGGAPRTLEWFDAPPAHALEAAGDLLHRLGAVDGSGGLTPLGRDLQRLPLHPRLGRILLAARGAPEAARACALLSERHFVPARPGATPCDLLAAVDRESDLPPHVQRVAREIRGAMRAVLGTGPAERIDETEFRRAVFAGYPDRVARRRAPRSDRFVLSSGTGARLARESGVHDAEFLVAVDVSGSAAGSGAEALIRLATSIDAEWLTPTSSEIRHALDEDGVVRAVRLERYDRLVLSEHPIPPDSEVARQMVEAEYVRRGPTPADEQVLQRLQFAGVSLSFEMLVHAAAAGARRLADVTPGAHVPPDVGRVLDREAPAAWKLPGGRSVRLQYRTDGRVVASTRLQDVFGLAETPRLGARRVPVTFELLAPNGRPVQVTNDLASFWSGAYPEIRDQLRRRYPKHKW